MRCITKDDLTDINHEKVGEIGDGLDNYSSVEIRFFRCFTVDVE